MINESTDIEVYQDDQVMVIAFVHNLHEPEHQLNQNQSIENQSCQNEQVKKNMPTVIYNVNRVGTLHEYMVPTMIFVHNQFS